MKKIFIIVLALALFIGGCGSDGADSGKIIADSTEIDKELDKTIDNPIRIGVIQYVQHGALDEAYVGFKDGLAEAGYIDGENIIIDLQNAQGEVANTNTIAAKLVNDGNDLILAIATPSAQAVANATDTIPILVTAVTDPAEAGLVNTNEAPGGNVTGTSDLSPVKQQIDLLIKFAPTAQNIGVIYSSNEPNSYLQAMIAKESLEALGLTCKEFTVSESNQIQQVVETAVGQVDAIYTPTDNMIASAMVQVSAIATEHGIPIVGGEEGQVENGALATFGVSYYELGKMTGGQAVRIIEGAEPATMPIEYQQDYKLRINETTLEALGMQMPENLE